jgi:hypothetical protein
VPDPPTQRMSLVFCSINGSLGSIKVVIVPAPVPGILYDNFVSAELRVSDRIRALVFVDS